MKKTAQKKPAKKNGAKAPAETAAPSAEAGTPFDLKSITRVEIPSQDQQMALADIAVVYNARTEFEQEMAELTASIAKWGVKTRLWVYPLDEPAESGAQYGLIAGERRYRAATAAGLLQVPVTVFACDVRTAEELGLIDNIQRQNLSEIDEAFAYKRMIEKHGMKAWSPEDQENSVGHKLGVSKTAVYTALKLTELPFEGLQALRKGDLSPSVGARIARIPGEMQKQEAILEAVDRHWTDEQAARHIERFYMTELKGAPFDPKSETLVPAAGGCEKCPKRSGNQAEMFPDMAKGRGDICLEPACFRGKCAAAFEIRAAKHREKGGVVFEGEQAEKVGLHSHNSSVGGAYAELSSNAHAVGLYGQTYKELLKPAIKDGSFVPILALANDGSGRHFEIVGVAAARKKLEEMGVIKVTAKEGREAKKLEREREELEKRMRAAKVAAIADRIALGEVLSREAQFVAWFRLAGAGIVAGLVKYGHAEALCARRELAPVESDNEVDDHRNALCIAAAKAETSDLAAALITEVLLDSQKDGDEEDDQVAAFAQLADIDLKEIAEGVRLVSKKKVAGLEVKSAAEGMRWEVERETDFKWNEHGVCTNAARLRLEFPKSAKLTIALECAKTAGGWVAASEYQFENSGHSAPVTKKGGIFAANKWAALAMEARSIYQLLFQHDQKPLAASGRLFEYIAEMAERAKDSKEEKPEEDSVPKMAAAQRARWAAGMTKKKEPCEAVKQLRANRAKRAAEANQPKDAVEEAAAV